MSQDNQYYVTSCDSGESLTIPPMKKLCEILTRKFEDIDFSVRYELLNIDRAVNLRHHP